MKKPKITINAKELAKLEKEINDNLNNDNISENVNLVISKNLDKSDSTIVSLVENQLKRDGLEGIINKSEIMRLLREARGDDHNGR